LVDVETSADVRSTPSAPERNTPAVYLMPGKLWLAAEPNTTCHGPCPALTRPGKNQAALEFRQPAEDRDHELAMGRRGIGPLIIERPEPGASICDRSQHV
jgi:hypothetical protein